MRYEDEHGHAGIEIWYRVGRNLAGENDIARKTDEPTPSGSNDEYGCDGNDTLLPAQHSDLQRVTVLRTLLVLTRMSPAIMSEDIDSQRNRLEKEVRVKVLVPEHEEQEEGIQIAYPEIIFTVAAGKEYACKTGH